MKPHVVINMAMTADGKIATENRKVTSFGSPEDLRRLYALRATADAILCGARTVEQSDATLGNGGEVFGRMRRRRGLTSEPLRVVVSGKGTISKNARIWRAGDAPIVVLTSARVSKRRLAALERLADVVWKGAGPEVDFRAALEWMSEVMKVSRLVVEGGGEVNDALIRSGLVDEIRLTLCPMIFGGSRAPTMAGGEGVDRLVDAAMFRCSRTERAGDEFFLTFVRKPR